MNTIHLLTKSWIRIALVLIVCTTGAMPSAEASSRGARKNHPSKGDTTSVSQQLSQTSGKQSPNDVTIDLDDDYNKRRASPHADDDTLDGLPADTDTTDTTATSETRDITPADLEEIETIRQQLAIQSQIAPHLQAGTTSFLLDPDSITGGFIISVPGTDINVMVAQPPRGFTITEVSSVPGTSTAIVVYKNNETGQLLVLGMGSSFHNERDPEKDEYSSSFTQQEILVVSRLLESLSDQTSNSIVWAHGPDVEAMREIQKLLKSLPNNTLVLSCNQTGTVCNGIPVTNATLLAFWNPGVQVIGPDPFKPSILSTKRGYDNTFLGVRLWDSDSGGETTNPIAQGFGIMMVDSTTPSLQVSTLNDRDFMLHTGLSVIQD